MKANKIEFNKSETEINSSITEILSQPISGKEIETKLKVIYSCIDNTTLEGSDTIEKIKFPFLCFIVRSTLSLCIAMCCWFCC